MGSCCKVKIESSNEPRKKNNYVVNFFKNILSILFSILVLVILMPIIFFFGLWVIFDSYIFKREHTLRTLIELIKKGVMGAFRYDEDIDEEELDTLDDLINNPDKYDIMGLDKSKKI